MDFQFFTVTSTYDPDTKTMTCISEPSPIVIEHGNTGLITVRLQVKEGQSERISFQANAVDWTEDPPQDSLVTTSEILITVPNLHEHKEAEEFSFEVNYVYTPPNGQPESGTGDPTIILEGTGGQAYNQPDS